MERPSGVSSASEESCAASAISASVTPGAGRNSVAWRLPKVIVPVLSSRSVFTSPAASTARPGHGEDVVLHQAIHAGNADGGEQAADGGWDEADQQRDQNEYGLRRSGIDGEGLQRDDRQQENDRQAGQKDVERDFVRRLLALCAFDERDHAIEEGFAGVRGDFDLDLIAENARASGDRGTIAAGFADDGSRFTGDGGLVDRCDAFDNLAVAGDELTRSN